MFICYFIATVFFWGDQLFYSSIAYQTDFRNGTKYICRTQYDDYHVTFNPFFRKIGKIKFYRNYEMVR